MSEEDTKPEGEDTTSGGDTITIRKDQIWKYSTFILAAIVVIGAFVSFSGDKGAPTGAVIHPPAAAPSPTAPPAQPSHVSAS